MNKQKRLEIFDRLATAIPDPETELNYTSAFELLIAVVLSAQATDKGVNKATTKLFPVANTPQSILDLEIEGLKNHIKTIGLFNTKGANIIKLCQRLLDEHKGEVPQTREELEALAGVGRKTANVILTPHLDNPPLPSILISSEYQIEPGWQKAKMYWKLKTIWKNGFPKNINWMHIIY
jgi:endonuclease-3